MLQRSQEQQAAEQQYQFSLGQSIRLANVAVTGHAAPLDDPRRAYPLNENITVVDMSDFASGQAAGITILQALQSRVPGLSISGTEPNMTIQMRGNRSLSGQQAPLILLDGTRTTVSALSFYQAVDIEKVEILKPGQTSFFGEAGVDGVIAIYTRRGSPSYDTRTEVVPGVLSVKLPGYSCPRQFYSPRYETGAAPTRPDTRRSTLYWNPSVRTDASGQADLTFYTSDAGGNFRLTAEGISGAGQPAVGYGNLFVK